MADHDVMIDVNVGESTTEADSGIENGKNDTSSEGDTVDSPSKKVHFDGDIYAQKPTQESDANVNEEKLLLAATLVLDAKRGRNMEFKNGHDHVKAYILYHKFYLRWLLYFFIIIDLALALVEHPAVPGWLAPYWATMIVEGICMAYFTFRICHCAYVTTKFWKDTKNIMVIGCIVLTMLDIICFIVWQNLVTPPTRAIRWSRSLRPFFIVNFSDGKQIRRAFRNIRRTVPDILNVLILFILSVFLFALLALKLFYKRKNLVYPNGDPYFKNYLDCVWDLYVLVTTANNPDVMMPAYDFNNFFAIFFIIYLIICLYIFMSIVLAAIYNNYKKNLKNEVRMSVYGKRRRLAKAFELLKVRRSGEYAITKSSWIKLMGIVLPTKSNAHLEVMMKVLDIGGNECIRKKQFMGLADLLQVELSEVKDRQTLIEKYFPKVYNSYASVLLKIVVRHKFFRYSFDFLIFINAFFIAFDIDDADWFFLSMFMLEIFLKLYTYGAKEFFMRFWNIFDFFVIAACVVASAVELIIGACKWALKYIFLNLRNGCFVIKLFGSIQRFKIIIMTIVNIGPSILTYGGVIMVFYYFYAIIGMEIFNNKIQYFGYNESTLLETQRYCGNPAIKDSTFYKSHYCSNNFNDLLKSIVLLFELTVVNQWHVLTSGFVLVTYKAARIYFFLFHLTCVVLVLNIFTAFILEAFILEYSLQKVPKLESQVEAKIKEMGLGIGSKKPNPKISSSTDSIELVDNEVPPDRREDDKGDDSDTDSIPDLSQEIGLKFHLKKKSRKKVEVLLMQMFEGEIEDDDEGPELNEEYYATRRPTLESIT
ncbi:LOW QUALITY PROTEIN: two pore calcium channel protein 1-like [Haliotis rubra]|uniref:LOW QUALITY PROTEIN: two pore calcium channel protein 1-like n=1 Tax=Haliotis rubra TaxID=36100 RepID=UPI001EE4F461|nr:LOW QUALITY PROTEIN: two pore calcium channel protein 1-like [Haliotis rubra]